MPSVQHSFKKPYKNVDGSSLTAQLSLIQDGYLDELGAFHRRPGIELFVDLGTNTKVDGLFWSDTKNTLIAVADGSIFKISDKFGTKTDLTSTKLISQKRATFSEVYNGSDLYLFMANGGSIVYTNYTALTQAISSGSTPPLTGTGSPPSTVTHIVNFNTYLIANSENSNSWHFSNPNLPFKWDVSDSYDAERRPDPVDAIVNVNNRLLICGKNSIEPWYNSGTPGDPLLRSLNASFVNAGILSPFTIDVVDEDRMLFINKDRRLASIRGNTYKVLSKPYDKEIQGFSEVSDANAFTINEGGKSFYVVNFPQAKRTLVYDLELDAWYEWGYWDENTSEYNAFRGNCYAYARKWNYHLIGSDVDGKIYKVSADYMNDDRNTMRSRIVTGNINWGNDSVMKSSYGLVGRFKRGAGKAGATYDVPYILIRKRDDGKSEWSNFKKVSLGALGDTSLRKTIYTRGGRYYSRQYEIVMPDDCPVVLSGLWEDVETSK